MTMKHQGSERTFKDPVCGMEVSRLTAVEEMDHQGKTYYFCSGNCRQARFGDDLTNHAQARPASLPHRSVGAATRANRQEGI
jgi:YHS domain-containing protein